MSATLSDIYDFNTLACILLQVYISLDSGCHRLGLSGGLAALFHCGGLKVNDRARGNVHQKLSGEWQWCWSQLRAHVFFPLQTVNQCTVQPFIINMLLAVSLWHSLPIDAVSFVSFCDGRGVIVNRGVVGCFSFGAQAMLVLCAAEWLAIVEPPGPPGWCGFFYPGSGWETFKSYVSFHAICNSSFYSSLALLLPNRWISSSFLDPHFQIVHNYLHFL